VEALDDRLREGAKIAEPVAHDGVDDARPARSSGTPRPSRATTCAALLEPSGPLQRFGIVTVDPERVCSAGAVERVCAATRVSWYSNRPQVRPEHRVLDAGCGRGGTALSIAGRMGASVDAVTISPYRCGQR
jgi:hypothetical protein